MAQEQLLLYPKPPEGYVLIKSTGTMKNVRGAGGMVKL